MDHLATRKERQDRWYASHVKPRYLPVVEQPSEHENFIDVGLDVDAGCIVGIPASLFSNDTAAAATQKHPSAAASSQLLHHALERDGFAVITGALTMDECERALELVWDYLEAASLVERQLQEQQLHPKKAPLVSGVVVRRDDPQTVLSSPYFPATVEGGILPYYGAGHSSFMWYLRSRAVVQDIFATLHGVSREELITSLDGLLAWRGCSRNDEHRTDHGWFHVDQNPQRKPDFCAVQGLVNLLPVTERTGGNVLVTGSHKVFPEHYVSGSGSGRSFNDSESHPPSDSCRDFYQTRLEEVEGDDWLEIDPTDARILGDRNKVVTCLLRPGDVLLWDSRTVHCSCPGIKEKEEEKDCSEDGGGAAATEGTKRNTDCGLTTGKKIESTKGLIRAAGLVTMMKRSSASKDVLAERKRAVRTSRTLTHWANKATPLGEERAEEVALETQRSSLMRNLTSLQQQGDIDSKKKPRSVLLTWEDLTFFQQRLVG